MATYAKPTPGEGAATEPRDEVAASLPGWMEGPAVSRADDPFSIPDEDLFPPCPRKHHCNNSNLFGRRKLCDYSY